MLWSKHFAGKREQIGFIREKSGELSGRQVVWMLKIREVCSHRSDLVTMIIVFKSVAEGTGALLHLGAFFLLPVLCVL